MPIRIRLIVLLFFGFLSLFLSQKYLLSVKMEKGFLEVEQKNAFESIERVNQAIEAQKEFLAGKITDWGEWDESYFFIAGENPNYLKKHIPNFDLFYKNLSSDFLAIYSRDGKILHSSSQKGSDPAQQLEMSQKDFQIIWEVIKNMNQRSKVGFLVGDHKIFSFAAAQVKKGNGQGEHNGYFVIGEYLQESYIRKLSENSRTQVHISALKPSDDLEQKMVILNDDQRLLSRPLNDVYGHPVLKLEFTEDRSMHKTFLKTSKEVRNSLFYILVFNFIMIILFFYFQILRPIKNFINWQTRITMKGDWKSSRFRTRFAPWKILGSFMTDDVDELSKSTNRMLDKIEDSISFIEKQTASLVNAEKFRSLGEMSGGIAHEINNPLAIILAQAHLLKKKLAQGNFQDNQALLVDGLTKIENTSLRIKKIISGLLSFARDGHNDPFENVQLISAIQDAIVLLAEKTNNLGIDLSFNYSEHFVVKGRSGLLTQVVYNLLSNSIDEIQNQPTKWLKINLLRKDHNVRIEVIDSGPGISKEIQDQIMQPFFTTKEVGKGTGLGLSISLGIIQDHGGTIYLNKDCENTCFVIELPIVH